MPSYFIVASVVLAARRAVCFLPLGNVGLAPLTPVGSVVRRLTLPCLCQPAPITSGRPRRWASCPGAQGRGSQVNIRHISNYTSRGRAQPLVDGDLSRRQPRRSAPAKSPSRTMVLSSREGRKGRKGQERKEPVEGEGVVEGAQGIEVVGVELRSFTTQSQEQHLTTRGKSLEAQEHLPKVRIAVGRQRGNSGVICNVNMGERLLSL
ncbi:hypothetical protein GW17_00056608 [Ensete ventricosum]|nr:hypothetical protein GW17_00056608 [Ensete ventricosum]